MKATKAEVTVFHRQFNDKKWDVIISSADPNMFKATPKAGLIYLFTFVHKKLGNVISSQNTNWNVQYGTETAVILTQDTQFEHG